MQGIDASGNRITEDLATNGVLASLSTTQSFIRLYDISVKGSGTYATATAMSHADSIVVEDTAGTEDWGTIDASIAALGKSQIGVYTIPVGKVGSILSVNAFSDSGKITDLILFERSNILEIAPPYTPMKELFDLRGTGEQLQFTPRSPVNGLMGPCDIGFMCKIDVGTAEVRCDFEILIVDAELTGLPT